ncbi:CheR family methyltransferase [Desulfobacterales bacterium HSG17]|nr:CheR family methyltransferase [Desulfobacterales bacterium HSG17]
MKEKSFDELVEKFLGMGLPKHLSGTLSLSKLPPYVQEFILRLLALMKQSGYSATQFSPALIRWLSITIPSVLPTAWGGCIPPITMPGRHKKIDDYITGIDWGSETKSHVFVDMGCGFPPLTTIETAKRLPEWQILGIDRSFGDYILYSKEGHYAYFDQKGKFQYFQGLMNLSGRSLYADPKGTIKRFNQFFSDLFPLLEGKNNNAVSETVEKDGNRLIHNYIRDFETDNLKFIQSDINDLKIPPAKVFRCMNVLIYFKPEIRKQILHKASRFLCDKGILITGTNGFGTQFRYTVYQKMGNSLLPKEFSFSLDNLGHLAIMTWFTIHKNDPEAMLLAKLIGIIRSNQSFWPECSNHIDVLLKQHEICQRKTDGYLHFPKEEMPFEILMKKNAILWKKMQEEGFTDLAVKVLSQAGHDAWKNSVGDISIKLPEDYMF